MENIEINETLENQEKIIGEMISKSDYISWLETFTDNLDGYYQNTIYDEDFKGSEEIGESCTPMDRNNGKNLYYFYEALKRIAYEKSMPAFMAQDKNYYIVSYNNADQLNIFEVGRYERDDNSYLYYCKMLESEELEFLNDYDVENKVIDFNEVLEDNKNKVKQK